MRRALSVGAADDYNYSPHDFVMMWKWWEIFPQIMKMEFQILK